MRLLALTLFATLALTATAGSHAYKSCSGGFDPDGSVGSFYRQIKAHNVSCAEARAETRAWVKAAQDAPFKRPRFVRGYTCGARGVAPDPNAPNGGLAVRCAKPGGRVVRFFGHP